MARIEHRSNSFACNATRLDHFTANEFLTDAAFLERYQRTRTVPGEIFKAAADRGVSIIPLLSAIAPAGGPVTRESIDQIGASLIDTIKTHGSPLDGLLLILSGTMTTTEATSGDEEIARAVRDAFPELPIVIALPLEANVSPGLVEACSHVVSSIPLDSGSTSKQGAKALETLIHVVQSDASLESTHRPLPILIPVAAQRPDVQPIRDILTRIEELNCDSDQTYSTFFAGYPYADFSNAGASIVVYSQSPEGGKQRADELEQMILDRRTEFFVDGSNVEEAVHNAMDAKDGPVLITDLGDNPDDGAPGDGTTLLWALLDLGVRNATIGAIVDEQAVDACFRAGEGAIMEIPVGGRLDTRHGYPIDIRGTVVSIHNGSFRLNGPFQKGLEIDPGRVAVLNIEARHDGNVELILSEKPVQITDTSLFEHVGIDLATRKIVSIKSTNDYRAAFEPVASAIYEVITPGITTPDPAFFGYQHVRRPIYPLDSI